MVSESSPQAAPPELEAKFWRMYREFLARAERKRRWSLCDDIPWDQCNPGRNPAVADVVESFTAVELYLPDYTSKILPVVRSSRGHAWFYANWGYEESKHSLALGDWLLRSGHRTEEQMADLEGMVFQREWDLPHDSRLGMLVYAMVQELATFLSYRNVRRQVEGSDGDPALARLLTFVSVDEAAHYDFFRRCVAVHLEHDREATLEQMRRVMHNFAMPAIGDLANSRARLAAIHAMDIMSEEIYYRDVYLPILHSLGVSRGEMRSRVRVPKSVPAAP
jgi:acyl-[acyl-carrier-protein] desaturase